MKTKIDNTKLYSVQEVAELLGITYRSVQNLYLHGDLAYIRLGHRTVRIEGATLKKYIDEREKTAAAK